MVRHILSTKNLSRATIASLFERTKAIAADGYNPSPGISKRRALMLFVQPSLRTRLGFEASFSRMGIEVSHITSVEQTRFTDYNQEDPQDACRVIAAYFDYLVVRHFSSQAVSDMAASCALPIINAGDGPNEHPSQALIDLFVLSERLPLHTSAIGLLGAPTARVFRSFLYASKTLGVQQIVLLSIYRDEFHRNFPDAMATCPSILFCESVECMLDTCAAIDILPYQIEDLSLPPEKICAKRLDTPEYFAVSVEKYMRSGNRPLLLHPGPRGSEIDRALDSCPENLMIEQVRVGLYVRMALIEYIDNVTE